MSYLGRPPSVPAGTRVVYEFVATEGQTVFSGEDEYGRILSYDPGYVNLFVNGRILSGLDFDALDGSRVTIKTGLPANTVVQVEAFGTFAIADVYSRLDVDSLLTGKVSNSLVKLLDFKKHNTSGLYVAFGDETAGLATPNAPVKSGNNRLTVLVSGDTQVTHYIVTMNSSGIHCMWSGIYYGETSGVSGSGTLKWNRELNDKDSPAGIPQPWPLTTAPSGWLICNGQSFSTANYPELAVAYPSGVLPDLRGEFLRGWDGGRNVDSGRVILSLQDQSLESHKHLFPVWTARLNDYPLTHPSLAGSTLLRQITPSSPQIDYDNYPYPFSTITEGGVVTGTTTPYGNAETRPRNVAFNYIVRAR